MQEALIRSVSAWEGEVPSDPKGWLITVAWRVFIDSARSDAARRDREVRFDTEVHPPLILLIRGDARLDEVEGIPDEYLQMNGTYEMTSEQRVEWEAEVRSLYPSMVRIVVTPTWAKLIDFEETLPIAVEELRREREARQRPSAS